MKHPVPSLGRQDEKLFLHLLILEPGPDPVLFFQNNFICVLVTWLLCCISLKKLTRNGSADFKWRIPCFMNYGEPVFSYAGMTMHALSLQCRSDLFQLITSWWIRLRERDCWLEEPRARFPWESSGHPSHGTVLTKKQKAGMKAICLLWIHWCTLYISFGFLSKKLQLTLCWDCMASLESASADRCCRAPSGGWRGNDKICSLFSKECFIFRACRNLSHGMVVSCSVWLWVRDVHSVLWENHLLC